MAARILKNFIVRCRSWIVQQKVQIRMAQTGERAPLVEGTISLSTRLAYALGHVYNDLAAAMWFTYTLIFFQRVAQLEPITAGILMLIGQVIDAMMTPVFGVLVDKYSTKKAWHVLGSVMVAVSFPPIYGSFMKDSRSTTSLVIYVISVLIFQSGWAAVQISHLSMIPALTSSIPLRAELTAIRYSAQVGAAVIVFVVTWMILPSTGDAVMQLGPKDSMKFRDIMIVTSIIGIASTIMFHAFLKARMLTCDPGPKSATTEAPAKGQMKSWLGDSLLARVAMLYVASRLFMTLATIYLPLYIEEMGIGGRQALATVPLSSYIASFIAAMLLKYMTRYCGNKMCYLLGSLMGVVTAAVSEYAGSNEPAMYLVAVLIGAGSSITMVTSLSITAELIGPRTESSALVYSIVTFLDKVVTGLVVIVIEKWRCIDKSLCPTYNRDTLSLVCLSSATLGLITLLCVSRCVTH